MLEAVHGVPAGDREPAKRPGSPPCCPDRAEACDECRAFMVGIAVARARVERYVRRRLRYEADVDDVVSEAYRRAWESRGTLRELVGGDVDRGVGWICRVAGGVVLNVRRSNRRRSGLNDRLRRERAYEPRLIPDVDFLGIAARQAWHALSPLERELLTMTVQGRKPAEIAALLGIPSTAVAMRVHRARKHLDRRLSE